MKPRVSLAACILLGLETLGCGSVVSQPIGAPVSADGGVDASLDTEPPATSSFCAGNGPIPLSGQSACIGDLATLFRFAACACGSFDVSGVFSTDSFDSTSDAGPGSGDLASIGSNGEISADSQLTIGGSIWTGGPGPDGGPSLTLGGGTGAGGTITHDIHSAAAVLVGGKYLVEGDVWANGNVTVQPGGSLAALGTVYVPPGSSASAVQATIVTASVPVIAPCSCATPINIASIVESYANDNDDLSIDLSPDASLTAAVALPCGRYYVAGIDGDTAAIQVNGRVALFVAGDVAVTKNLSIQLATGAELDLFVAGDVSIMGGLEVGDPKSPARTRLYVGGGTFALAASASPLAANVYAPNAVLELASDFEMWGSIFADRLQLSGAFAIHYDTSVLRVAESAGCTSAGGPCQTCGDCSGSTPACKAGTCVPCTTTADCCAPFICSASGRCNLGLQ